MISTIVSKLVILVFGTLYPAYASYKAVKTKNVKEYVKWMMYWIVFALFSCAETFTDVFLSWFPFYYEIKIVLVLWLLSPATKGSSILYRKFVHPMLSRKEQEIDDYIAKAKEQGYHTVLNLGTKGVNYATTVIMQTAIKGGGGLVNQLRKSYSLSDLTDTPDSRANARGLPEHLDDENEILESRHHRRRHSPRRSSSGSSRVEMYFSEMDVRQSTSLTHSDHVRSTEDISSGYSSAEPLYVGQPPKLEAREGLVRTGSVGGSTRSRTRTTRAGVAATKKTTTTATVPEDSEESESETESSELTIIRPMPKVLNISKLSRTSKSSDESDNSDFVDAVGFSVELPSKKVEETVSVGCKTTLIENNISNDLNQSNNNTDNVTKDINDLTSNEIEIISNTEITVVKEPSLDVFEESSSVQLKIEKLNENDNKYSESKSNELKVNIEETINTEFIQKSIDSINTTEITEEKIINFEITDTKLEIKIDTNKDIENVVKKQEIEIKEESNTKEIDIKPEELKEKEEESKTEENKSVKINEDVLSKVDEIEDNGEYETLNISSVTPRGGKYNKHTAPVPPSKLDKSEISSEKSEISSIHDHSSTKTDLSETFSNPPIETHPIKATLVLKPGIMKSVGPPTEDPNKTQIFVSQSPKLKHKSKSNSPISRLMMLPKKIFGHKDTGHSSSNESLKRKSWHEDTRSLTPSSIEDVVLSKSDTEGSYEQLVFKKEEKNPVSSNKDYEENKLILRTLSHSPKQYRRRTKEDRRNDYEDSD